LLLKEQMNFLLASRGFFESSTPLWYKVQLLQAHFCFQRTQTR